MFKKGVKFRIMEAVRACSVARQAGFPRPHRTDRAAGASFGMMGMSLGMGLSLRLEQCLGLAQKLELKLYQKREELFTRLYEKAVEQGKIRTYKKHGLEFEYALVSKKDIPAKIIKAYGYAFSHCLYDGFEALFLGKTYALSRGEWMRFVVEDAHPNIPPEYIEYAAVHEHGEAATLGNHLFATRLEFSIAEKEGKLDQYLAWIKANAPEKIAFLAQLKPGVVFPDDDQFLDEIIALTSSNPALNIIRACPWPKYLLDILRNHLPPGQVGNFGSANGRPFWVHQTASLISLEALRRIGHKSAYLEIGTGGGKTYIAAQDAINYQQAHPGAKILWLAHRRELLDQAENTFRELWPGARIARKAKDIDLSGVDILIVSKQSLEANPLDEDSFSYVVVDEAHHAYAEGYKDVLEFYQADFKLGITATPRRFSDRKHIRDLFGEAALKMNLLDLVRADIISPVRFRKIETNVEVEAKLDAGGEFDLPSFWQQIKDTPRNHLVVDAYLNLEETKKGKPAITFCVNVEHAKQMASLYNDAGVKAEAIHGNLPLSERNRIIKAFRNGEIQMLTAVDILSEGVDFPPVEVSLMARPTRSKTVWLQQVGRGVRKSESTAKKDLLVIDFVDNVSHYRYQLTFEDIFVPVGGRGGGGPEREPKETKEGRIEDVYIENIIDMNLDEIYGVIPLQPHELTAPMLAESIGVSRSLIQAAIKDGRIKEFVRRTIQISGREASVFDEEDVEKIKAILHVDRLPLHPHELTTSMLAESIGVSRSLIQAAIKDGRIKDFVRRTIRHAGREAPIFNEEDVEKIRTFFRLQSHELTTSMLAERIGVADTTIGAAIKDGRIKDYVRRTIQISGREASFFNEEDVEKIKVILFAEQLQPNELTTLMLAKKIGISIATIARAIKDGRIKGFIRRTLQIHGREASVFNEKDIENIRAILDANKLQPHELTIPMLAERIGVADTTIGAAIKDGRIKDFVRRTIRHAGREAPIFNEEDVDKIRQILGR